MSCRNDYPPDPKRKADKQQFKNCHESRATITQSITRQSAHDSIDYAMNPGPRCSNPKKSSETHACQVGTISRLLDDYCCLLVGHLHFPTRLYRLFNVKN